MRNNRIRILILVLILPVSTVMLAQSGYRVEISQVFPRKTSVYSNVFNIKRELDSAVSYQSAKLRGNSCNYIIHIKTPSGSETRYIQNITWVESINGVKNYHKRQTSPSASYKSATSWQGYACNIDGSTRGTIKKVDFYYRISIKGAKDEYETEFITLSRAKSEAKRIFEKKRTPENLVEVVIFKIIGREKTQVESLSNMEEYMAYKQARDKADSIEYEKMKEQHSIRTHIDSFLTCLSDIRVKKDSLQYESVTLCKNALEELASFIPDSIFTTEKLDSVYYSLLFEDILSDSESNIRSLQFELQRKMIENDTIEVKTLLLNYTRQIESYLTSSSHDSYEKPVFAYEKKIPPGAQAYSFVLNGVKYSYYKLTSNTGELVNEETKEYEIGTFEILQDENGQFIYKAKKVKKYTSNGERKH